VTVESQRDVDGRDRVGRVVASVPERMLDALEPGMTTAELDALGDAWLPEHGARSAPRLTQRSTDRDSALPLPRRPPRAQATTCALSIVLLDGTSLYHGTRLATERERAGTRAARAAAERRRRRSGRVRRRRCLRRCAHARGGLTRMPLAVMR
jgi:hypothetical protein